MVFLYRWIPGLLLATVIQGWLYAAENPESKREPQWQVQGSGSNAGGASDGNAIFAQVDDQRISVGEFMSVLHNAIQKKYYHGKIPEEQLKSFRRETANALVDQVLLLKAARNANIPVNEKEINQRLQVLENRMQHRPDWPQMKTQFLEMKRKQYAEEALLFKFQDKIQALPTPPSAKQIHDYYQKHLDKFTTPAQLRVAVILLKVEPSSPKSVWAAARDEGQRLYQQLQKGEDFAKLARIHSGDSSAAQGGDMGFLHQGMLAPGVQEVLDKMKPGQIAPPQSLLQGIAIFKLIARTPPVQNPLEQVKPRVLELLAQELKAEKWRAYLLGLRKNAKISINEQYL